MYASILVSLLLASSSVRAAAVHIPYHNRADVSVAATATATILDTLSTDPALKLLLTSGAAAALSTGELDITAIIASVVGTNAAAIASASAEAASYVGEGGDLASLLGTATALVTAEPSATSLNLYDTATAVSESVSSSSMVSTTVVAAASSSASTAVLTGSGPAETVVNNRAFVAAVTLVTVVVSLTLI